MRTARILRTILAATLLVATSGFAQQPSPPLADLKAAAEAGDTTAQDKLGDAYRTRGDLEDAVAWYRRSAPKGALNSEYQLAHILLSWAHSPSVKAATASSHADEAIPFLLKAASLGHKRAQVELGQLYLEAKFLRADSPEAYKWFCLASAHDGGILDIDSSLAKHYRDSLILKMTQDQIAEGNRRIANFQAHPGAPTPTPEPASFAHLKLQGITGTPDRQLAIINGTTVATNESATIKLDGRPFTIHCLAITSSSATIAITGFPPKQLTLR